MASQPSKPSMGISRECLPSRGHRVLMVVSCLGLAWAAPASALDTDLYGRLLAQYTNEVADTAGTRVDYGRLRSSPEWGRLVQSLAETLPEGLNRNAALAFWINAYNIFAIDLVARSYPVESIRDVGSFLRPVWGREAGEIGGRSYTLDEIEHEILRPLGDPRVHAAIVCASTSCPSLRRSPYEAASVEAQLDDAVRRWLSNPNKGLRIEPARQLVILSRIFDWFGDDFGASGGVLSFAARYAPPSTREWLLNNLSGVMVEYFAYDWSLNDLSSPTARY